MRALILIPAIALAACNSSSWANSHSSGGGDRRSYDVGAFHAVALGGRDSVIVTVGGPPSVRAEGPASVLDALEIKVVDGTLHIEDRQKWGWHSSNPNEHATVYVSVPELSRAALGGSGEIRVDKVAGGRFDGSVAGSGDLQIGRLEVDQASFSNTGSGGIKAAGSAATVRISILGSGDVDAAALATRSADVSIAGSGDAAVHASQSAKVSIMGSGDVTVQGGAKCSVSKLGSGDVHCTA